MITLIQMSKRSAKRTEEDFTTNEAKEFLYEIDARNFRINHFIILSRDSEEELQEVVDYFNEDYLIKEENETFVAYKVNETIGKYDRMRNVGASIKAIKNFQVKIQNEYPESEVSIIFNRDNFDILIQQKSRDLKIVCNYQLVIQEALVLNHEWEFVSINENDSIVNFVNKLFRKQRYYYKQKNGD